MKKRHILDARVLCASVAVELEATMRRARMARAAGKLPLMRDHVHVARNLNRVHRGCIQLCRRWSKSA